MQTLIFSILIFFGLIGFLYLTYVIRDFVDYFTKVVTQILIKITPGAKIKNKQQLEKDLDKFLHEENDDG